MSRTLRTLVLIAASLSLLSTLATAGSVPIGFMSYDVTGLNIAQFDVSNQTGINSSPFPDMTWPVTTPVPLTVTTLVVNFQSGPPQTFGPGYFTLSGDGLSLDGTPLSTLNPIVSATLTGTFNVTDLTLNNGNHLTIDPGFSLFLSDPSGTLQDGDSEILYGTFSSAVPEPSTLAVLGSGLGSFVFLWRRKRKIQPSNSSAKAARRGLLGLLGVFCCAAMLVQSASAVSTPIHLNAWTSPSTGTSGVNNVNVTGSGFPGGVITPADVTSISLALSCGGAGTSATALKVTKILGSSDRIEFLVPSGLSTANYFVSMSGTTSTGNPWSSSNCSEVSVTQSNKTLASCVPGSSLGILLGKTTVVAYEPNGYWEGGTTGVRVVPLEGGGSPTAIPTPNIVNSCGSNSQTGESVCTANNTDVYLITGSSLNTKLTSGSNNFASFSGGSCMNCGVAINSLTNTAAINMGFSGLSGDGIQLLDLTANTFSPPVASHANVSENISIDPNRSLILSPGEFDGGIYDIFQLTSGGGLLEFENGLGFSNDFLDSAAEDCTTGIALSTSEDTLNLFIADLTQATYVAGSPGSWTAPGQFVTFPEFSSFGAGTSGISVAPGTSHMGITTGEFGSNEFGVFLLPSTSGSGTPAFVDYAAAFLPNTPDGDIFSLGFDPHTISAYTSPNNSKAYGVVASWATGQPNYLGVLDLQCVLNAPRQAGTHFVQAGYDLIANGCLRYVKTF
jgi:PEP-CTERM motif